MSGQSGGYRLHLSTLNDQLTCKLCEGYFIDATTIIECLHSFCRSCIIKYLENNKYCPICEVQVHKSKPLLNIRPDHTLQDIVYKLVPGCYQNEMRCRREFYSKYPESRSQAGSPESRGEPIESHIYSLDESLSLSLEYYIPNSKEQAESEKESTVKTLPRRYLRCPAAVTVFHLQKLIRAKYGLSDAHRVDIMYKEEPLCGNYTLMDVMYIYHWRRKVPLHLSYRIFESSPKRIKLSEDNHVYEQILSNTRVDSHEFKSEQSEKREWKEVQLKISETGVMSVTDISTFEKKNVSNGASNAGQLVTVDKSSDRVERVDKIEKASKTKVAKEVMKESFEKSSSQVTQNVSTTKTEAPKSPRSILPAPETRKALGKMEENPNVGSLESQKVSPVPTGSQDSTKAVTRSDTEGESLASCGQKFSGQSKLRNSLAQESTHAKNGQECPSTKKVDSKLVNTNNNFITTEGKADSQKENSKGSGKEVKNASTSVEPKQNVQSSMIPFLPKVGQVNNTYSKKISKEKKSALVSSRKLDSKTGPPDQSKSDVKPSAHFANTKSHVTATVSVTKLTTSLVSSPQSTTMSTQTVNTFVSAPQGSCLFVTAPQMTTCVLSNSTVVSSVQNSLSSSKTIPLNPKNLDCQAARAADQRPAPATSVLSDSAGQNVKSLVKNNNNNPTSTSQSLASIGLNVSTAMPGATETISSHTYAVQNLVSTSQAKNTDDKSEINSPNEKLGSHASDAQIGAQNLSIYSVTMPTNNSPRFSAPQTSNAPKRTNAQSGIEITSIYTVPPCPDAIPISLMKPTVRKHEIIAKGTNLNEICAKIGESSKEKIKAATRSKPEIPNLLKITKKTAADSNKCIPNVPIVPAYAPGNNTVPGEDKSNVCINKETSKASPAVATSQSVPTLVPAQKLCSAKKQSQPVGYKTLRDPPKSWNPTLSKNNYVAVRNQAKEMQNQTQAISVSGGSGAKPIHSKPAKIFKMRNVPRYLGNPASGVKPMYGVSNDSKDKDPGAQNTQKSSSLSMMTIDPKTLSPIVSTANSSIISPPPPYSPNPRSYQNSQFPREICPHPGSPISPRNSPINMLSTNPFIPSPTLNTNPRLIYTPFPPPFPDTSRFPNPLIRSPMGIASPSAFHSSLPASINNYQRTSYHVPATGYGTPKPPTPTIQKILPSMHSSPKSPKSSTAINTTPMFTLGKTETQLSTRVENIALHLAKNAAKQELNIVNFSKTGNSTSTNFQNLSSPTTATLSTSGYSLTETLQNVTTQTTARSEPQLEIKVPETDTSKVKSKEPENVDLEAMEKRPLTMKAKSSDGNTEPMAEKDIEIKEKMVTKVNGEVATKNDTIPLSGESDGETLSRNMETGLVPAQKEQSSKEAFEIADKSVEMNSERVSNEAKGEEAVCKTADQIQGKKSDVQRNKPES